MSTSTRYFTRHFTARVHQTFAVDVPAEMYENPDYFDPDGTPTPAFDQWVCDMGRLRDEETEPADDDDLNYELES